MAEKVTVMRLKVDLQCDKCYRKVKKVLCKFPQIRDQVFDEKQNIVIIKVVCCNPEKIRDKLCCKGRGCIKSIEIVEPPKPKPPEPEKPKPPPEPEKKKEPEKQKPPAEPEKKKEKPKEEPPKKEPKPKPEPEKQKPPEAKPALPPPAEPPKPAPKPPAPAPPPSCPVPGYPPPAPVPIGMCCPECYAGRPGGPCFQGYGGPPPCYGGYYYGRPVYDSYGGRGPCYVSRCDQYYFSEENTSGCTIM